jgi:hypothetical protein
VGQRYGVETALPDEAGPFPFRDELDLAERNSTADRFAERLFRREPGRQPLGGERRRGACVGELGLGEQTPQSLHTFALDEGGDAGDLDEVHA